MTRRQRNVLLAVEQGDCVELRHNARVVRSLLEKGLVRRRDPAPGEFPLTHLRVTPEGEKALKKEFA